MSRPGTATGGCKEVLQWLLKAGISSIISLAALSMITVVYSHTGIHVSNETGATDYKWKPYQFRSNMTEGFSWFRMNGEGFNNSFDFADVDGVDILLMGSSHMEAVNISKDKNAGYFLNESFPEWTTYNIGISGHTIYQCADNLEAAVSYYKPSKYVVIETNRVRLDEKQMEEVINYNLADIPSHDSGLRYAVQKYIPCFLPLYRELKNWMSLSAAVEAKVEESKDGVGNEKEYTALLESFIKRIADTVDIGKVIIFYHPNTVIDEKGVLSEEGRDSSEEFAAICRKNGIIFVNMYEDFKELYERDHKLAHGFANTAVGVGHLNEEGHKVIASKLAEVIKVQEDGIK